MKQVTFSLRMPVVLCCLLIVGLLSGCRTKPNDKIVTLRVGLQKSPSNALIILTKLKGYYDSTKLNLELVPFEAGKLAYQELNSRASSLDLAVAAETPFVLSTLNSPPDVVVIGSVVRAKNEARLVVANDGSATSIASFFAKKRRKIATSLGGSPEYTYWRFLRDYKLDSTKIEKVGMKPSEMPAAIGKGIDGIVVFDPPAYKAAEKLGTRGRTFINYLPVLTFYNMYVPNKILPAKEEAIKTLFAGILQTQAWVKSNPKEAQQLIAQYTGIDVKIVAATWPSYAYELLAPATELKNLCEDEVRWANATGKGSGTSPNFDSYFNSKIYQMAHQQKVTQSN